MSTLLIQLAGNMTFNQTIFPPYLLVYDDLLIYKRRNWFWVKEITVSYSQVTQIAVTRGIFFSKIELLTTGDEKILIKFVPKKEAAIAKRIIDQKLYHAHAKHQPDMGKDASVLHNFEKSINRLKELVEKGHMSEKEFTKRKEQLLKNVK